MGGGVRWNDRRDQVADAQEEKRSPIKELTCPAALMPASRVCPAGGECRLGFGFGAEGGWGGRGAEFKPGGVGGAIRQEGASQAWVAASLPVARAGVARAPC